MNKQKTLFLIDGYGFVFRAYHSLPPMKSPKGEPVSAIYGFTNMLVKLKQKFESAINPYALVVVDSGKKTFRSEIYSQYKANRPPAPEDLVPQFPIIEHASLALGIQCEGKIGYEADDIIASYVKKFKSLEGGDSKIIIVSSDKDLMQLIDDNVQMYDAMRDVEITSDKVHQKFGIPPFLMRDYLALVGDASDNIPGVPTIGAKTAVGLLEEFGNLDGILANTCDIKQKSKRQSIQENIDKAKISYQLVGLDDGVALKHEIAELEYKQPNDELLFQFLKKYGFNSIMARLFRGKEQRLAELQASITTDENNNANSTDDTGSGYNKNSGDAGDISAMQAYQEVCLESLVCNLEEQQQATLLQLTIEAGDDSIKFATRSGRYLCHKASFLEGATEEKDKANNKGNDGNGEGERDNRRSATKVDGGQKTPHVISRLFAILKNSAITKITYNLKSLLHFLYQVSPREFLMISHQTLASFEDIQIMAYLTDGVKNIETLAEFTKYFAEENPNSNINNTNSTNSLFGLYSVYFHKIITNKLANIYYLVEKPFIFSAFNMEICGVFIDSEFLQQYSASLDTELQQIKQQIKEDSGKYLAKNQSLDQSSIQTPIQMHAQPSTQSLEDVNVDVNVNRENHTPPMELGLKYSDDFNIASPKQVAEFLYETLQLTPIKKSRKTGGFSTDATTLETLAIRAIEEDDLGMANIINNILKWRAIAKLKTTYTDSLPSYINEKTGRIHSCFQLTSTTTGRISSKNPNLQNIPIRSEQGRKIRQAFTICASEENQLEENGEQSEICLISADYSQIELRLLAEIADVKVLKQAFANGSDIHAVTASEVFAINLEDVTPDLRRKAKTINFGIIYGQTSFGLAKQLGISKKNAKEYIERYFSKYPGIRKYMDATIMQARQNGFTRTKMGRKCFISGINAKNFTAKSMAERAAINAPIQGLAADIMKTAIIMVDKFLMEKYPDAKLILQIHDEILIQAKKIDANNIINNISKIMRNITQLNIPLEVSADYGTSWDKIH